MSAPVCSRRVSAGITPAPGVYAGQPAWWGVTDWSEFEVPAAVQQHRDLCSEHHVAPDTVIAVARGMARFADHRTGRECRPTNERLVAVVRASLSTVQRARRVLKALGLVAEVTAGRSIMTRSERLIAWRRGSAHRRIAAEFALCSRRDRSPTPVDNRGADLQVVERDTPPGSGTVSAPLTSRSTRLRGTDETRRTASRPAHTEKSRRRPPGRLDPRSRRLAEAARSRLAWLSGVHARRLTPTLHRFAQADWTPRDVERAVDEALAARGWRLPARLQHPAAYLATLLREIDPADRPGALEEHMAAVDRAQRAYERQVVYGAPCPHGQPAGDVPSPLRGLLACPECRQLASSVPPATSAEVADAAGR